MPVRDAERLVKEPCAFLSRMPVSATAVQKGIAQADRGEFIEEQEMDARSEQMLNS
jgi:predicted transcriptional regulator